MIRKKAKNQSGLWGRIFVSQLFVVAAIIIASMVTFSYARTYYQDYQVKQEMVRLQDDARKLETKKIELLEALTYVKSPAFVEQKAKSELNMAKTGEKAMIIQSSSTPTINIRQAQSAVVELVSISNYRKWWNLFMED